MIDKIDEQLIGLLAKNGRATLNDLAKKVVFQYLHARPELKN